MRKVLLELNGSMCAGKSTISETLMKRDGFFKSSYDKIKFLISNYSENNADQRRIAREISLQTISEAMDHGLSVIVDGGHHAYRDRYREIAKKNGFEYISINIEAPYEVLRQRFLERVAAGKKIDRPHILVTTIEGFDLRYRWYVNENKDQHAAATLDSSIFSLDEIIAEIDELIE